MRISYVHIENFKYIKNLSISEIEEGLILVGKNNTGKTAVLDAIRLMAGDYEIKDTDYYQKDKSIVIDIKLEFLPEDIELFWQNKVVSKLKRREQWEKEFQTRLPSYHDNVLEFSYILTPTGTAKYSDGVKKNNGYIKEVLPKIYHIGHDRNLSGIEDEVLRLYDKQSLGELRDNVCMFDHKRECNRCFQCIGLIHKKNPEELTVFETGKLLEYKMLEVNLQTFSDKVNRYFHENGSASRDIRYVVDFHVEEAFQLKTKVYNKERETIGDINQLSDGFRSIYTLSLLEAYIEEKETIPCVIMIKDPEIYLHPQLQKAAGEILYRLSKKNQVIFSTHSPNLIFNFSGKQIKQVVLDEDYNTTIKENADIDEILDDLGYTANDLMNVNFVFIVEGKQDSNRLPMLLEKYYSEIYDDSGKLNRISIITTNSCTNIKTYANLKYMNQLYIKDQFLMIRDSDGKNPKHLKKQLCSYYSNREKEDVGNLPRVQPKNVLILKYYSFENYFLDPSVMMKIGVIRNEEEFYSTLYNKYRDYLYKLPSMKRLIKNYGIRIRNKEDIKQNMELIKIYVRGHNLFDIFYGRYRHKGEEELLKQYIEVAPREVFDDILRAIDDFVYFDSRKK